MEYLDQSMRVSNALVCTSNSKSVVQTIKEETNSAMSGIFIIMVVVVVEACWAWLRRESMSGARERDFEQHDRATKCQLVFTVARATRDISSSYSAY
jgi:hypothetical protein